MNTRFPSRAVSISEATARGREWAAAREPSPLLTVIAGVVITAIVLAATEGGLALAQATINGIVSGSYFALGAAGLTLVYGVLKLVNFAHGEFLTFAAYIVVLGHGTLSFPLALAFVLAVAVTAVFALGLEFVMWRPMRRKGAGVLQLLLMALGLAFVIRNVIQLVAGTDVRTIGANVTASVTVGELHIGRTELRAVLVALLALLALALMLRRTRLGREIRALSDSPELAETTGIDTNRIITYTWLLAGGLAGLAGVVYSASVGVVTPQLGFGIVLSLFAAVVVGGIGNVFGALAGGMLIGLAQEWSTLVFPANIKVAVGFGVMILVLILRPQGLFGQARSVDR
jgi:neutral amino acid transport system permease protein